MLNLFEGKEVFRDPTFINASYIKTLVEQFEEDGEIVNHGVARSLQAHLDTVVRFEKLEAAKRIVKHLQRFNKLLDKHKKDGLISEDAYNTLKTCTDSLIKKWQKDCNKDLGYQVDVE
ncbi:FIMAH domain-containing protein [Peribacillus simplex]|uniref:FIMAH domain-containing protein n=1 Tax=Peribacillus simplex TaxID=1478 RepID=UPI0035C6FFF4